MCKVTKAGGKLLNWIIKMCLQRRKCRERGKERKRQVMVDYEEIEFCCYLILSVYLKAILMGKPEFFSLTRGKRG